MSSRHTKYRDTTSNIKVLLRQQTNMTLNERFRKIMKMPAPPPPRPQTPPRDSRLKEELRLKQRKLESLQQNTLQMMSQSLAKLSNPLPTAQVYQPPIPKPSVKARLGGGRVGASPRTGASAQSRIGAKRLTQRYAAMRNTRPTRNSFAGLTRGGARSSNRGGATATTPTRGASGRGGAARGGVRGKGAARGGGRGGKQPAPDKDALDSELDKYMSKSRSYLDTQLDDYMAQKGGEKEATA